MDHLEIIEKSKEKAWMALEDAAEKNDYSAASIDLMYKAVKILKNGEEVIMNEVLREGDWGGDEEHEGGSYASHRVGGGNSYRNGGNEGRRVGGSNTRGEYNGNSYKRDRYGRYSRDDGKDRMMVMIDELMGMASDENQRTAIRRMKEELERI